jgi:predicted DNA-binding transcriptional regulator AlpA
LALRRSSLQPRLSFLVAHSLLTRNPLNCSNLTKVEWILWVEAPHPVFTNMQPDTKLSRTTNPALERHFSIVPEPTSLRALNTTEAAAMMGISPATLRGWKAQRSGPPFIQLSPRCVRYDHRDIQQYVNERRTVPACENRRRT